MSKTGEDYAHLAPKARAWAQQASDAMRVKRILTDRWVGYTRADQALARLEWLLRHPKRLRMPNLLIVGPTNNGKTMIAEKFRRDHGRSAALEGADQTPVLSVQCPDAADPRRFHQRIAEGLGAPQNAGDSLSKKEAQSLRLLAAAQVRVLIVDEVHNILAGATDKMNQMLNLFRFLGNELRLCIVAVGVKEALQGKRNALPTYRSCAAF